MRNASANHPKKKCTTASYSQKLSYPGALVPALGRHLVVDELLLIDGKTSSKGGTLSAMMSNHAEELLMVAIM